MSFMQGQTPDGKFRDVALDASGAVKTAPGTAGAQPAASSQSIVPASDADMAKDTTLAAMSAAFGKQDDVAASGDGVAGTHMSFMKRISSLLNLIAGRLPTALGFRGSSAALSTVPCASQVANNGTTAAQTASQIIRPLNASRLGAVITNDSTAVLYLLFAVSGAGPTNYTLALGPGDALILNAGDYQGPISGAWSSAVGQARFSEIS